MKWITAFDLDAWAGRTSSRLAFPRLIADLIRASADDIGAFRFPNGEMGQVPGFDGLLESDDGVAPYVPQGRSIWEFGTNADAIAKVDDDYDKRTAQVSDEDRAETTFVFVTPRTWKTPKKKIATWVAAKVKAKKWKDVRFIDGVQLESWLDSHPAVAAHWARQELKLTPSRGARGTDEFWRQYSRRFKPPLSEDVVLCSRQAQADKLVEALIRGDQQIKLMADSPEEVIAFAVAAIRKADAPKRAFLEARTLVIDTAEAASELIQKDGLIFLPRGTAYSEVGSLSEKGPTLVSAGADTPRDKFELLERPAIHAFGKALMTMAIEEESAMDLARKCGRSLSVLARRIPSGKPDRPEWLDQADGLLPALLAGAWDSGNDPDKAVLQKFAQSATYDTVERPLRKLRKLSDPPIDKAGSVWKMRAPVDAFTYLADRLGADDLNALAEIAKQVFGKVITPPKAGDAFKLGVKPPETHSTWLRDGLATMLLHIAVLSDPVDLTIPGKTPQRFVDDIIQSLPGLKTDGRLLASLRDNLTHLAEASPESFLSALEHLLEGDASAIRPLFLESDEFFAPSSPHTGVLWGLEVLAWDPALLFRVSKVLARLAVADPGGKMQNRPANSLRDIFLSWSPNTNATAKQRGAVLESITREFPAIAWELLVKLLPRNSDHTSPGQKPLFREAGGSDVEVLTYGIVWGAQNDVVTLALGLVNEDPARMTTMINQLTQVPPESFHAIVHAVTKYLEAKPDAAGYEVWKAVQHEAGRNRTYQETNWALKDEAILKLEAVVKRFQPKDPLLINTILFDDWQPHIDGVREDDPNAVDAARERAVGAVMSFGGVPAVIELAQKVKVPYLVIPALEKVTLSLEDSHDLVVRAISVGTADMISMAASVSAWKFQSDRKAWGELLIDTAGELGWSAETFAYLLLQLPDGMDSWQLADGFGEDVATAYWATKHPFSTKSSADDLKYALDRYLSAGRALAAMSAAHSRLSEVDSPRLMRMLEEAVPQINASQPTDTTMATYYIEAVFKALNGRPDVTDDQIANKEYAYLALLEMRKEPLKLHQLIVQRPELFVDIVKLVFKPATGEAPQLTEVESRQATSAYRVLKGISVVPGQTGDHVDEGAAIAWSLEVQKRVAEVDRKRIGEQYLGHVLAHAPADSDDGGWPHRAIRAAIEKLASEDVEAGIQTERFNMRGVYSKLMGAGGTEERDFAEITRAWAKKASAYPRTMAMLLSLAEGWEAQAASEDLRAEKDKLKY